VYSKLINGVLYFINSQGNLYSKDKNGQVKTLLKRPDISKKNAYLDEPGHLITNDYKYYSIFSGVNSKIDNILNPKISNYRSVYMNNGIKAMFYKDSCLYMQNRRRIYKIDYRNIALGSEIHDSIRLVTDSVSFNRIFCATQDDNNNIWYATTIGLYKITDNNSVFQPAFQNINFKHFDFFSGLLIGYTTENTLLIFRSRNKSLLIDTVPHQNCIWDKFYQIDSSNILISTNNKYRLLHVKNQGGKLKITVTAVENVFIPLHCESIAVDKQNCYFFKNGDIFSISTSLLKAHESTPTVFFNKLFADKSIIPISENIILPFNSSRKLTISYSSIFFDGDDLIYQYAVSGKQKSEWKDIDGEINLINTGYGDYTISIRAKTSADTYSVPASFQLTILKPFWLSYWFLSVVFLLLVVLIVFSVRYRLTRAIHIKDTEHKSKIKYLKAEFKAMNALINPHFIFNTLNNVQSLINNSDKKEANEYLRVFADLIRQNMHNVSRELITLEKEIMLVKNYLYLENFRFGDKLKYTINIQEYLDLSEIMVPPLLLQPLVENAIKHGILKLKSATGEIKIEIYEVNESVHIDIYDNGVGLRQGNKNRAHLHESFALENIKSRLTYLSEIQNRKITFSITEKNNTEGLHEWTIASIIIAFD
jgi:two-component sensor histidine kinase